MGHGLVEGRLEGPGVDFEEEVALLDRLSFLVDLLQQIPAHLGANLGVHQTIGGADPFGIDGNVRLRHLHHSHLGRRGDCGGLLLLFTPGAQNEQGDAHQEAQQPAPAVQQTVEVASPSRWLSSEDLFILHAIYSLMMSIMRPAHLGAARPRRGPESLEKQGTAYGLDGIFYHKYL